MANKKKVKKKINKETDVIIHIGIPKSGTTLFQQHIFTDQSRFYTLGRFGIGGDQCIDADLREFIWDGLYYDERTWLLHESRFKSAIQKHLKIAKDKGLKTIISNEAMSMNYYGKADFDARFKRLKDCFGDSAKIVMLTRRQDKWMKSYYSSLVCDAGASMSFKRLFEINQHMPLNEHYVMSSLDYYHIATVASRYFDQVNIMPFELLHTENGSQLLGQLIDEPGVVIPNEKVNQSRSAEHIAYSRALNQKFPVGLACAAENMPALFHKEVFNQVLRKSQQGQPLDQFESELLGLTSAERNQQMLTLHNPKDLKTICNLLRIKPLTDDIEPTEEQMQILIQSFKDSNSKLSKMTGVNLKELGYF